MALDSESLGAESAPKQLAYDWKMVALYALGIGARRDELAHVYEGRDASRPELRVLPTFAVVPAYPAVDELMSRVGGNRDTIVHYAQSVTVHAPAPPQGTLTTVGKVAGLYDMKRMAQAVFTTRTEADGQLLFETSWTILYRDDGGFGGPRPPKAAPAAPPKDARPTWEHAETTSPEQALLYRLSGDLNPLHADPEFARATGFDEPILHGLCTYGFVARAIILEACAGDANRLQSFHAQFRRPVLPGEALVTRGWDLGEGRVAVQAYAGGRDEAVITGCWAELREPG